MRPTTAIEDALTQLLRAALWWITIIVVSTQRWHRLAKHRALQPLAARRNQLLVMVGRETFMLVFLLKHLQGNRLGLGLERKQLVLVAHPPLRIFTLAIQLHPFLKIRSRAVYLRDNMAAFILYVSIILCIYRVTMVTLA